MKLFLNEKFILVLILLNATIIFFGGFPLSIENEIILEYFDQLLTLLFLIELIIKLNKYGFKCYFSSSWNRFDFLLIVIAVPSLITLFTGGYFLELEFLLVFRIMRVFKFFRFIKFIPRVDHIINGVVRASKASILIIIAFFIFNFIVSLISTYLFRNTAPEYFSNPILAFYSTFKIFTVEGWYEIPESITENSSSTMSFLVRIYFVAILIVGGIFGLSIVNSIFVDAMVSENTKDVEGEIKLLHEKMDKLLARET